MSDIFGTHPKVGFVAAKMNTKAGMGALLNFGGKANKSSYRMGAIVTGFSTSDPDVYTLTRCLGGRNYLTAFGPGARSTTVTLTTSLGGLCARGSETSTARLKGFQDAYNEHRLTSKNPVFSTLVVGNTAIEGFLVDMKMANQGPYLLTITYTLLHPGNRDNPVGT